MEKTEAIKLIKTGHIVEGLMAYAMANGAEKINELPGILELKIDDAWTVKCNGHDKKIDSIPAYSWYIEYKGWPAGVLDIFGDGVLCDEASLRKALIENIEQKKMFDYGNRYTGKAKKNCSQAQIPCSEYESRR